MISSLGIGALFMGIFSGMSIATALFFFIESQDYGNIRKDLVAFGTIFFILGILIPIMVLYG